MEKEIYYHGSGILFPKFDLAHALEGDGKVKFGYGVYVTSSYPSAAHYSGANDGWTEHYVYSVEIPAKKEDNFIAFKQPVNPAVIARAEEKLQMALPEKAKADGKEFRKFLAGRFLSKDIKDKKLAALESEKAASCFLFSIGIDFIEWPDCWKRPALGSNRAVLDDAQVKIVSVDTVELDDKKKLIRGSEKQVR